jgi:hypothetical protein
MSLVLTNGSQLMNFTVVIPPDDDLNSLQLVEFVEISRDQQCFRQTNSRSPENFR